MNKVQVVSDWMQDGCGIWCPKITVDHPGAVGSTWSNPRASHAAPVAVTGEIDDATLAAIQADSAYAGKVTLL